jgi:hypothetical protein
LFYVPVKMNISSLDEHGSLDMIGEAVAKIEQGTKSVDKPLDILEYYSRVGL